MYRYAVTYVNHTILTQFFNARDAREAADKFRQFSNLNILSIKKVGRARY